MLARFERARDSNPDPIIPNYASRSRQGQINRRFTSSSQQGQSTSPCSLCSRTGQGPREEFCRSASCTSYRCWGEYAVTSISLPYRADPISASNSTPLQLVSVLVHTHSSWTLGVPIPGLVLTVTTPISLVQIPKTQGLPCQYSMAAEISQARNVSVFHDYSHQSSTIDNVTECVL